MGDRNDTEDCSGHAAALSRRSVVKGVAAAAGVAAASGGFPTIWAQDIKDIKLRSVGGAWSHFGLLEDMANEALDFSVQLTAVSLPDIQARALTQTKSSDLFEAHIIQMNFPLAVRQVPGMGHDEARQLGLSRRSL